ncbi:MAG: hypothetical protein ACREBB_04525 [Nitrosotalea sp.]
MKTLHFVIIAIAAVVFFATNYASAQTPQYNFQIWPADPWIAPGYWEAIQGKICPTPVPDANTSPSVKVYFGISGWEALQANASQIVLESGTLPSCENSLNVTSMRPNYTDTTYPVYAVAQWTQNGKNQTVQSNSTHFFSLETCPVAYSVQTDGTMYYAGQTVLATVTEDFGGCHILPTNVLLKVFDVTNDTLSNDLVYQETRSVKEQAGFNFTLPEFTPQNTPHKYHIEILYAYDKTTNVTQDTYIYSYNYANNPPYWVQMTRFTQDILMIKPSNQWSFVAYGDNVKFFGYQEDPQQEQLGDPTLPTYFNNLTNGKPAIAGVLVNVRVTDPLGNTVYNKTEATDNNGQFPEMTFSITKDLKRGLYEAYYSATKDGGIVFTDGGTYGQVDDYFVVGNKTTFKTDWGGKSFQFSYYGVDTDASNFVFSQPNKTITFDIHKINGTFSRKDHVQTWGPDYNFVGYPIITIEKPLLTGPFISTINGKLINSSVTASDGSENGPEMVGSVEENGNLTFTGTYVVPEFPLAIPVLLISITALIVFYRLKFTIN